jgi:hypothetical protein
MDTPTGTTAAPRLRKIHPNMPEPLYERLRAYATRRHLAIQAAVIVLVEEGLDQDDRDHESRLAG